MKKWFAAGAGAVAVPLAVVTVVIVTFAILVGSVISITAGGAGSLFADKNLQNQYGMFGCDAGTGGSGPGVPVSGNSTEYVRTIIGVAKSMNVPVNGQIIAVMTMMQESNMQNYANSGQNRRGFAGFPAPGAQYWLNVAKMSLNYPHDAVGNDADSVGLFQQRASAGWADDANFKASSNPDAAIKRLLDPRWGAQAFFGGPGGPANRGLLDVAGWQSMPKGQVAQKVQVSAFPDAYNKWEAQATQLVMANQDAPTAALVGGGAPAAPAPGGGSDSGTTNSAVQYPLAEGTYAVSQRAYGMRMHPILGIMRMHAGQDFGADTGTPLYSIADGVVSAVGINGGYGNWVVVDHNLNGKKYSSLFAHIMDGGTYVRMGQPVKKGDKIAAVGSTGLSTAPHSHFEIWEGGRFDGGHHIDPMPFLGGNHMNSAGAGAECNGGGGPIGAAGTAGAILQSYSTILGTPYSWGGGDLNGPTRGILWGGHDGRNVVGFDCSSSVRYAVYHGTGADSGGLILPRTAQEQYNFTRGTTVWNPGQGTDMLQPGDLLYYGSSTGNITHTALYIGGGRMYEEPGIGRQAWETDLRTSRMVAVTRLELSSVSENG